jgi:farnesol dehydrogenase
MTINQHRKILITGASGFIGTWLVKHALDRGAEVRAISRSGQLSPPPGFAWTPNPFDSERLRIVSSDVTDAAAMIAAAKGCTHIFHLAGLARNWARDRRDFYRVNVQGTRNVLAAARQAGAERVVVTSSAVTLGPTAPGKLHDETTPRITDRPFHDYEATKNEAEQVAIRCAAEGQQVVIVNPTRVYGPGHLSESNALPLLIEDYVRGRMPLLINRGVNVGNYAFVHDVVQGHWAAMDKGRSGERYILGGDNVSLRELADLVDEVSGRRHFRVSIGRWTPMLFAYLQIAGARLLGFHPKVTPGWVRMFMSDGAYDGAKAVRELDLSLTPFCEGLKITFDWMGRVRPTKDHRRLEERRSSREGKLDRGPQSPGAVATAERDDPVPAEGKSQSP